MTDYDDNDDLGGPGTRVQRLVTLSGALVSVALVCGMGVWGYKLTVRDVHGVPVVQAMEGAFRIAPEDPGGTEAPYQGLAVNEVAAEGTAGGPTEQVTLAPEPTDLAAEDTPRPVLEADAQDIEAAPDQATMAAAGDDSLPDIDADMDELMAAQGETVDDAEPEGALAIDMAVAEALAGDMETDLVAADGETLAPATDAVSLRPSPRPQALRTASVGQESTPLPATTQIPVGPTEIEPSQLASGTRLVQLGAFTSEDMAREEWAAIADQFGADFTGKRRVVQTAQSGGATFYRLRAEGFTDLAEARRFCAKLIAGKADCIPVELR